MLQAERPLAVIRERLEEIQEDNGYNTNAGNNVYRGRVFLDRDSELPAITIVETEENPATADVSGSLVRETVNYQIRGVAQADPDNPLDQGHVLVADIKKALFRAPTIDMERLDGTITNLSYTGRGIFPPEDGSRYVYVEVYLEVTHGEQFGNPEGAV